MTILLRTLIVIEPNPRLFGQSVHFDFSGSREEVLQFRYLCVGRESFDKDLDFGTDPGIVRAGLLETSSPSPTPSRGTSAPTSRGSSPTTATETATATSHSYKLPIK